MTVQVQKKLKLFTIEPIYRFFIEYKSKHIGTIGLIFGD